MKICFFSIVTHWHGLRGGMENHGKLLLEGLSSRGHEIRVISTRHPHGIEYERKGNIHFYYLASTRFGSVRNGWRKESQRNFLSLNDTNRFDIICSQQPIFPPIRTSIRHRIPVVTLIQAHEAWVLISEVNQFVSLKNNPKSFAKNILALVYQYFRWELYNFRKSDVIVTPSDEVSRSLGRLFLIRPSKVRTIYNGVDTKLFRPDTTAKFKIINRHPQLKGKKIILFMSHVTRQKGLHFLIRVLPSLIARGHDIVLLAVGDGEFLEDARRMSVELGVSDRAVFTGMVDNRAVAEYINSADIFVLPTLRREGLPLSILEAMACRKPVIASRIGGNESAVKDAMTGILIPPGNTLKLEESISLLLSDKELAARLAENAYTSVFEKFALEKMIDKYERLMMDQIRIKFTKMGR
jgi:glycosyltransferase involved in cell wall biosynthesis